MEGISNERDLALNNGVQAEGTNRCRNWVLLLLRDWNYWTSHVPFICCGVNEHSFTVKRNEGKSHRSNFHCTDVQRNAKYEPKWRDDLRLGARSACKTGKYSVGGKVPCSRHTARTARFPFLTNNKFWEEFIECLPLFPNTPRPDLIVTVCIYNLSTSLHHFL